MRRILSRVLPFWTALLLIAVSVVVKAAEVGPEKGYLVIVGGAIRGPTIYQRFLDLAGGPDASIVVIPTASGADTYGAY